MRFLMTLQMTFQLRERENGFYSLTYQNVNVDKGLAKLISNLFRASHTHSQTPNDKWNPKRMTFCHRHDILVRISNNSFANNNTYFISCDYKFPFQNVIVCCCYFYCFGSPAWLLFVIACNGHGVIRLVGT